MQQFIKSFLGAILLLGTLSCTPSVPYEIKSPCVAAEEDTDSFAIMPCVRRPANLNYAIT